MIGSVAIHVAAGILLLVLHATPQERTRRTILVEVNQRSTPAPATEPTPVAAAPAVERPVPNRRSSSKRHPAHPQPIARPTEPIPQPPRPPVSPPANPPTPVTRPPGKPDLFNRDAIARALPSLNSPTGTMNWGGTTRRLGDGKGDPNARDATFDREQAESRVRDIIGGLTSAERLKSGNVAPRWREAERNAQQSFHPTSGMVSDDNAVVSFLKNWLRQEHKGGNTPRGVDPSAAGGFNGMGLGDPNMTTEVTGLAKTRTEVEVVVAADGSVISAKIVQRSGHRKFDQEALELVRRNCATGGALDEKATVKTRWAVEAWLNVTPPAPSMGFSFDEVSGKIGGNYPLKKNVQTKVQLLSIARM